MAENVSKYVYEVLALVDKAATKQEKLDLLKKNDSVVLKNVLKGTFDDSIEWDLPEGTPPYTPCDGHNAPSNLTRQLENFPYFVKGHKKDLLKVKREMMFIRLLESIHPEDAKVVLAMVAKKLPVKGLTKTLVKEAFPNLIRK